MRDPDTSPSEEEGATKTEGETDTPKDLRFGSVVKHYRTLAKLTQTELAHALGYKTPEWVGQIESGVRVVPLDRVPALAYALRIDAHALTKLALTELYPRAAGALFSDDALGHLSASHLPGSAPPHQPVRLLPETVEAAKALENLGPRYQKVVHDLIAALGESTPRSNRSRR